jgi:hypothetical protein
MTRHRVRSLVGLAFVVVVGPAARLGSQSPDQAPRYAVTDSIVVGNVDGRMFDLDVINRRLYGAGNTIIDIDSRRVIGHIADSTPGTEYFVAAEAGRGLTNTGVVFNPSTGALGEHLPIHGTTIAYDPLMRRAFLLADTIAVVNLAQLTQQFAMVQRGRMGQGGMGGGMQPGQAGDFGPQSRGRGDTVIRRIPAVRLTATIVGEVPLVGAGASGVSDGRGRMFISLTGPDSVAIVDVEKLKVIGGRPLQPCKAPLGLAIDNVHDRLFAACDSQVVVISLSDGHISGQVPTGGHAAAIAFDKGAGLLFVPAGPQGIAIVQQRDAEHYVLAQTITDPRVTGASALVIDPTTHRVFVPHRAPDGTFSFMILSPSM